MRKIAPILILILLVLFSSESFSQNKAKFPQNKAVLTQKKAVNNSDYLTDQSGNTYKTVKIGTQVWMAENFKAKHYSNGDPIAEHILKIDKYGNEGTDFNGNNPFVAVLPNGNYVYSGGAISDPRGIAPIGWHLPSQADWEELGAVSTNSKDFKSISGWSPIIYPGSYDIVDCPICKNWNSEYRSKRACDRCQDTRQINGKYIPKKIIPLNGNNRLKFNLQDVGFIEEWHLRSSSESGASFLGFNDSMSAYWTSDEDKSPYERGPFCLVIPQVRSGANDFPKFENYRKKLNLLPIRLVKNKE